MALERQNVYSYGSSTLLLSDQQNYKFVTLSVKELKDFLLFPAEDILKLVSIFMRAFPWKVHP